MSRPLRLEIPDGIYHVTSRGNAKQDVLVDEEDCRAFLGILRTTSARQGWSCLAYALMPNHYHLIVRTPTANLSDGMRQLNGVYAQRFNRRRGRVGHVWQGRFAASLVQADSHLFEALRYVALNPVRAGLCAAPEEWPWSSHAAVVGRRRSTIVNVAEVLALFGATPSRARVAYTGLVAEETGSSTEISPPIHGDVAFTQAVMRQTNATREVPVRERCAARPPVEVVLATSDPDHGILEAYRVHGYRLQEIAEALGCHYSTVSRRLRAAEARLADA